MSTSSSTLTSVLSALGGASGIDVTAAVDSIIYADRAPERTWQGEQATLASQTTSINQLNNDASTLSDQLFNLQGVGSVLDSVSVTSSDSSVVTATAADGTAIGNHSVVVNSLATTASWYSQEEASGSTQLTDGTSFAITTGGTTTTINIGSGNDTLNELASSINNQSLGVTASVVTDSNGARLSLVANSSGSASNFTVSGSGLSFTQAQTGADASLKVDGVPITSASNTVTGAIAGVTLNLQSVPSNGETVNLTLSPDTTDITTAITNFVSAYNTLIGDVSSDIAYNSATSTAGVLQADSTAQSFYSDLLSATNYNSGSSISNTLESLGISTNSNGTLSLDAGTLSNALRSNPAAVSSFFEGAAGSGFSESLTNTLNTYTDPSNGAFTVDLSSISAENQDLSQQTATLETYISSQQTILTTEYNNADIAIQQLPEQIKNTDALLGLNQNSNSN
jgi:flagellar hook-associated protein 2